MFIVAGKRTSTILFDRCLYGFKVFGFGQHGTVEMDGAILLGLNSTAHNVDLTMTKGIDGRS